MFPQPDDTPASSPPDTLNRFAVTASEGRVFIAGIGSLNLEHSQRRGITKDEALNLAAWLVVMSECSLSLEPSGPSGANPALEVVRDLVYAIKRT